MIAADRLGAEFQASKTLGHGRIAGPLNIKQPTSFGTLVFTRRLSTDVDVTP